MVPHLEHTELMAVVTNADICICTYVGIGPKQKEKTLGAVPAMYFCPGVFSRHAPNPINQGIVSCMHYSLLIIIIAYGQTKASVLGAIQSSIA